MTADPQGTPSPAAPPGGERPTEADVVFDSAGAAIPVVYDVEMLPAAQPDGAAELVEKCARAIREHHRTGSAGWYVNGSGGRMFTRVFCKCGESFKADRDPVANKMWSEHAARAALSVLDHGIGEVIRSGLHRAAAIARGETP